MYYAIEGAASAQPLLHPPKRIPARRAQDCATSKACQIESVPNLPDYDCRLDRYGGRGLLLHWCGPVQRVALDACLLAAAITR